MEDLLLIALILSVIWYWWDTQQTNEIANAVCKQKCINAGLQLLDATVTRQKTWLRKNVNAGGVQICRLYSFEYNDESVNEFSQSAFGDRNHGYIVLIGKQVIETHLSDKQATKSDKPNMH